MTGFYPISALKTILKRDNNLNVEIGHAITNKRKTVSIDRLKLYNERDYKNEMISWIKFEKDNETELHANNDDLSEYDIKDENDAMMIDWVDRAIYI